ncbi:MAG: bifunctional phosphoribosylaminoimidazolecarboxamide formyltransferase/IMP cyclohydrolase, partial [Pseudomonadota bacterium]
MVDGSRRLRRALLSVSDKTGLVELAAGLLGHGVELVSTGGTAAALAAAGFAVRDVATLTGFPEMMDGRVKTLHPGVHGGLLARRDDPDHMRALADAGLVEIDLLVSNLYPFEAAQRAGAAPDTMIETIDIGGPAMIRAAAKNHASVAVLVEPGAYAPFLAALDEGAGTTTLPLRRRLAAEAFARTAAYDAAVSAWMAAAEGDAMPQRQSRAGARAAVLRYGENPHQRAAFYRTSPSRPGVATAVQHQGKALSWNNINDTDAAFELVAEFAPEAGPAVAIIKHANPCGVARAQTQAAAWQAAFDTDRLSAFGGIVAFNTPLEGETAALMRDIFTEVVIAPGASRAAHEALADRANLRLLTTDALPDPAAPGQTWRDVAGGYLLQDRDCGQIGAGDLTTVTARAPTDSERRDLLFAWRVAKHTKSNAIVFARDGATVGIGAGQMSRVDSAAIAVQKAVRMADSLGQTTPMTEGAVLASDAFFPFADGLQAAIDAGARAVIQPGGSVRDAEVIAAADAAGIAMVFTGMRHFR